MKKIKEIKILEPKIKEIKKAKEEKNDEEEIELSDEIENPLFEEREGKKLKLFLEEENQNPKRLEDTLFNIPKKGKDKNEGKSFSYESEDPVYGGGFYGESNGSYRSDNENEFDQEEQRSKSYINEIENEEDPFENSNHGITRHKKRR